jgi:hypothetical protein
MPNTAGNPIAGLDLAGFLADAASVIGLRVFRIASGGRAGRKEAKLMVTEKIAALAQVQWNLMSGAYGFTPQSITQGVGDHYAKAVRANRKRLSASAKR